jgi:hypothetical protein
MWVYGDTNQVDRNARELIYLVQNPDRFFYYDYK